MLQLSMTFSSDTIHVKSSVTPPTTPKRETQPSPPRLQYNWNALPHRTISQTITPPQLFQFHPNTFQLYEKYYDESTQSVIDTQKPLTMPLQIEMSTHLCSRRYLEDTVVAFPDLRPFKIIIILIDTHILTDSRTLFPQFHKIVYAIPTFYPINSDMTVFTIENGEFKDALLVTCVSLMITLRELIYKRAGELNIDLQTVFFDGVEPSTGCPYLTSSSSSVYSEVEGSATLLKYKREQSGQCCLLQHPKYGLSCYPSTMFLSGFPLEEFYRIFSSITIPVE